MLEPRKKKVLFHSNWSKLKTGFGRNAKTILTYLAETNKYDLVEYACNANLKFSDPTCSIMPWKCYGSLPDNEQEIAHIQDPAQLRAVSYGGWNIDKVVEIEKPDVYIGVEDLWGMGGYWDKKWWKTVTPALWTTLDSIPLISAAVDNVNKIPNFWVWASFAEDEMKLLGHNHVKTVHGVFPTEKFFPLPDDHKFNLRKHFKIDPETKIFGFVFRNQLRKLVGSLLEGFAIFKKKNPTVKSKILLHTNWAEGWNIPEFIKEFNLSDEDILTTYFCHNCQEIDILPFIGQGVGCRFCGNQKSLNNPSISRGCSEEQLNLVYNLMDAYIHPITSGGLEMPIVEAMLTGLPVSTVPYSCGTEFTTNDFVHSISYTTYREIGANFIKASADANSIASFMQKAATNPAKYKEFGAKSREWALKEFDINTIGKFIEDFIDNASFVDEDKWEVFKPKERNSKYPNPNIQDETEWLLDMYKNILRMDETPNSEGVLYWRDRLAQGTSRNQIYDFFIKTGEQENVQFKKIKLDSFFTENNKKKMVYVMPKSLGDCVLSLTILDELRKIYNKDEWDIYVCTEEVNFQIFKPFLGELIENLIPYSRDLDNYKIWEGSGEHPGVCDIVFMPYGQTQRFENYTHNSLDKNQLQLR